MVESPYSLYKLIILFTLRQVSYPLKNTQIADLFAQYDYTSYFHLQQVLAEMVDTDLLLMESGDHTTLYRIAPRGEETLSFFSDDIPEAIRREIAVYLEEHASALRSEALAASEYIRTAGSAFTVHCQLTEGADVLVDLTLSVPTEQEAQTLSEHWKTRSAAVYEAILQALR